MRNFDFTMGGVKSHHGVKHHSEIQLSLQSEWVSLRLEHVNRYKTQMAHRSEFLGFTTSKNHYRSSCKGRHRYKDTLCPRCKLERGNEDHLMAHCPRLHNLRQKFNTTSYIMKFTWEILISLWAEWSEIQLSLRSEWVSLWLEHVNRYKTQMAHRSEFLGFATGKTHYRSSCKGRHRYKDTLSPRCKLERDDEDHLMAHCPRLHNLRQKFNITSYIMKYRNQQTFMHK